MAAIADGIELSRPYHVGLYYHVLAHLDLGADAASIYDHRLPARGWAAPLTAAYQVAAGRLVLQILPVCVNEFGTLLGLLARSRLRELEDSAGQRVAEGLRDALLAEAPHYSLSWRETEAIRWSFVMGLARRLAPPLARARDWLWSEAEQEAPLLHLIDCDALGHAVGTHGRATTLRGVRHVVASLAAPFDQLLCQVLHEVIHDLTDEKVRRHFGNGPQVTRPDQSGYWLHAALEGEAVVRGQVLIDQVLPDYRKAYAAWRKRHGV
jgi:hypothetical protein